MASPSRLPARATFPVGPPVPCAKPASGALMETVVPLAVAALSGLAVGLEREWSGHATGPDARFAGLRTFFLLGLLGGAAGLLAAASLTWVAAAVALGGAALCVAAYVTAVRREHATPDGTTEAAALVVIVLGVLAG